jgi:shikimate kinase
MQGPIWLIGMMGSGKSTVAPIVAAALDRDWVDSDSLIEGRLGMPAAEALVESEDRFRSVEIEVIRSLVDEPVVVATGGGAATTAAAAIMRSSGVIVWLRTAVATLAGRVGDGAGRPLLSGGNDALMRIDSDRREIYAQLAAVVVDTDDLEPAAIARLVVEECANASSEV